MKGVDDAWPFARCNWVLARPATIARDAPARRPVDTWACLFQQRWIRACAEREKVQKEQGSQIYPSLCRIFLNKRVEGTPSGLGYLSMPGGGGSEARLKD
jgi:hypothetical protein